MLDVGRTEARPSRFGNLRGDARYVSDDNLVMQTFRTKFRDKFRKYRAILILTNNITPAERDEIDGHLASLDRMATRDLRERSRELDAMLTEVTSTFGVSATLAELLAPLSDDPAPLPNVQSYRLVPKHRLQKLFKHYERTLPIFPRLAPHARIGVDLHAVRGSDPVEIYLLEATLFEDMAILWNEAMDAQSSIDPNAPASLVVKRAGALRRAVVKGVFSLLEGYVNGLAFDILLLRRVSPSDEAKLREWDNARNRPLRLTLRDKLLQYPKIATDATHPPLQESGSEALRYVLAAEHEIRHALIHPTPQHDIQTANNRLREEPLYVQTLEDVGSLCDAALEVITSVAGIVGPDFGDASFWLCRRNSNGRFGPQAFA